LIHENIEEKRSLAPSKYTLNSPTAICDSKNFSEEKTLDTTFRARKDKAEGREMIKEDGGLEGDGKNQLILDTSIFQPLERHCRHMQRNKHEQQMS
jgi:hypothetical protein